MQLASSCLSNEASCFVYNAAFPFAGSSPMVLHPKEGAMIRLIPHLVCLVLLSPFLAGCQTTESERLRQVNDDGVYLFSQGNYQGARECFELAHTLSPQDPALVFNLGQCQERLSDVKQAEQSFRHCLEMKADHADARQSLAALLKRTGRGAEANRLIEDWVKNHPNTPDSLSLEGWRLRQEKNYPLAQERLQQALALDPHHRRALVELGILYETSGRPERALVIYERVLARDPRQSDVSQRRQQLQAQGVARPLPD